MINKIQTLYKNHPKAIVAGLLLVLLIVVLLVFRIADKYMNFSKTSTKNYYIYVGDQKYEFKSEVTTNREGIISEFKPDKNILYGTLPIYGDEEIVLPAEMLIMIFDSNVREYRTNAFATIKDDDVKTLGFDKNIDAYFLFDSKNEYLFNQSGTLSIDSEDIELSAFSYVIVMDDEVHYYDKSNDKYVIRRYNDSVAFKSGSYSVDLKNDTYGTEGNILPNSLDNIELLGKYKSLQK